MPIAQAEIDQPQERTGEKSIFHPFWSGGALAAWMLSLLLHVAAMGGMLLAVFPLAAVSDESPSHRIHVQLIGDIDATGTVPAQLPDLTAQSAPGAPGIPGGLHVAPGTLPLPGVPGRSTGGSASAVDGIGQARPDFTSLGLGQGQGGIDPSGTGLSIGGGAAPDFFGLGGSAPGAKSVVYVVDRSASMIGTFNHVRGELRRSITQLRRSQKFHVIFFNSREPIENLPQKLVNAIGAHKEQFFQFLDDIEPQGGTKPEKALQRAFSLEPDVLYLLSDGINFNPALIAKVREWNKDRKSKVFTIAYLDPTGRELLETLSREHGGDFKFVSEDDLP